LGYLANLCNSTIIETYVDIIRVSHGFDGCQMLEYIADSTNSLFFKKGCLTCNLDRFEIFAIYEPYPQFYHQ
jgi:hypothetical protein